MNEKLNKLNEILIDIVENKNMRYEDLLNHEYVDNAIGGAVARFYRKGSLDYEDIKSEAKAITLCDLLNTFKYDNQEDSGKLFLNYIKCNLEKRLIRNIGNIAQSEENVTSLEGLEVPPDVIDEDNFTQDDFSEDLIFELDLINYCIKDFNEKEKKVYYMIFKEDLTEEEIASKLNLTQPTIHWYKDKVIKKFKNFIYNLI